MIARIEGISFNSLYEIAQPTAGSFKDHIGCVKYTTPDGTLYKTLIMTKTDPNLIINGNKYSTIAGYIQVKPFLDQAMSQQKEKAGVQLKCKSVRQWKENNKKWIKSRCQDPDTELLWTIGIEGSKDIQGTYFHPLAFTQALKWACPLFESILSAEFEQQIVEQNQKIKLDTEIIQDSTTKALSAANLEQFEVNAPYMFEPDLPTDLEEEKQQQAQEIFTTDRSSEIERQIKEINAQINQTQDPAVKVELMERKCALTDDLMKERIANSSHRNGVIYSLHWVQTGDPMYVGLSEQAGTARQEPHEIRFYQHTKDVVNVFKGHDIAHIAIAGELAKYMIQNDVKHVTTDLVHKVVYSNKIKSARFAPGELQDVETKYIQEYIQQGHFIYNSNKRAEVSRSNSKSFDQRDNQPANERLQRMRNASNSVVERPKPVQQIISQYINLVIPEEGKDSKQSRKQCSSCQKSYWPSKFEGHVCKSAKRPNIHKI